jgi:molecular chaperone GrpE
MESLLQALYRGEFVIDEPREKVLDLSSLRPRALRDSEGGEALPDLLSQIAAMLLEHERLEQLANELRQKGNQTTDQQLVRFFRMVLSVLDGFDRLNQMAMEFPPSEETRNWLKSVSATASRLVGVCENFGLKTMDPVGRPVDLDRHEVVEVLYNDSIPDETVVEVRQKGYIFNGKVLRDARVVVAKNERR